MQPQEAPGQLGHMPFLQMRQLCLVWQVLLPNLVKMQLNFLQPNQHKNDKSGSSLGEASFVSVFAISFYANKLNLVQKDTTYRFLIIIILGGNNNSTNG
jgi:hypothetical protein